MTIKEIIASILSASKGSISSKRVCGVVGFAVAIFVLLYCTFKRIEAPTFVVDFTYACAALLGVDSITGIWKKDN